jgi:hypothetical protein
MDWLVRLLIDLGITQELPILIYCDNQAALALIKNPDYQNKGKHADLKYYYIRDARASGLLTFEYTNTKDQFIDVFTKAVPRDAHQRFCTLISMTTLSTEQVGVSSGSRSVKTVEE